MTPINRKTDPWPKRFLDNKKYPSSLLSQNVSVRSKRFQIFYKIGALKNFPKFSGKFM